MTQFLKEIKWLQFQRKGYELEWTFNFQKLKWSCMGSSSQKHRLIFVYQALLLLCRLQKINTKGLSGQGPPETRVEDEYSVLIVELALGQGSQALGNSGAEAMFIFKDLKMVECSNEMSHDLTNFMCMWDLFQQWDSCNPW